MLCHTLIVIQMLSWGPKQLSPTCHWVKKHLLDHTIPCKAYRTTHPSVQICNERRPLQPTSLTAVICLHVACTRHKQCTKRHGTVCPCKSNTVIVVGVSHKVTAFGKVLVGLQLNDPVPHAVGCAICLQQDQLLAPHAPSPGWHAF